MQGDDTGPRTKLSPEEVAERLNTETAIAYRRGFAFFSEEDGHCLQVITSGRTIVTVMGFERIDIFTRLRAEYLVRGTSVLHEEPLPEPVRTREDACTFELRYVRSEQRNVVVILRTRPLSTWFGFRASHFWNRSFVETLSQNVADALDEVPAENCTTMLYGTRGHYGDFQVPSHHVFACLT